MKREVDISIVDFWLDNSSTVTNAKLKVKVRIKFPSQVAIYRTIAI